jgi:hypothetical protein
MNGDLSLFRSALQAHDPRASDAVSDELLQQIVNDEREENPGCSDAKLAERVRTVAYNVAHEVILEG